MILNIMGWQHFTQLDYIRKLSLNEQLKRYNYYLAEQQALQIQLAAQQAIGSGGAKSNSPNLIAAKCIEFQADTTVGGTTFELTVNTFTETPVGVVTNWGDGITTQDTITTTGTISHTFPSANQVYLTNMCFNDPSNVSELIFSGTI